MLHKGIDSAKNEPLHDLGSFAEYVDDEKILGYVINTGNEQFICWNRWLDPCDFGEGTMVLLSKESVKRYIKEGPLPKGWTIHPILLGDEVNV